MMKSIFLVQDFSLNTRINYHDVIRTVKNKLYLIAYNTTTEQLNSYINQRYPNHEFVQTFALPEPNINMIRIIIADYIAIHGNEIAIVTNTESAVRICGQLNKEFGTGNDDMVRYVDKIAMKQALCGIVNIPRYVKFSNTDYLKNSKKYLDNISNMFGMPFFVKPIAQYSSRGTMQINKLEEFKMWHQRYHQDGDAEIDELVRGTLYHCDAFIKNGEILYTQVCEYLLPCYDFILGKPSGSFTLPNNSPDFKLLDEYNTKVLKHLGMPQGGLTHLEVFKREDGELVFLEVAARPAGAQVPAVYSKSLNLSIREVHLLLQIDANYNPKINQEIYCGFVSYPIQQGTVTHFNDYSISSEHTIHWNIKLGDQLIAPNKITDVAGTIVLWNNNHDVLRHDMTYLRDFKAFSVL